MVRKIIRMAAAACLLAMGAMAEETAVDSKVFKEAVSSLDKLFAQDFQVRFASDEMAAFISEKVQKLTKQLGMPLQIDIRDFLLQFDEKSKTFRNQLRLKNTDDFLTAALQEQVNSLLRRDHGQLGKIISDMSLGSLQKLNAFLVENADGFQYVGEEKNMSRYRFEPKQLEVGGMSVRRVEALVNHEDRTVGELTVQFDENRRIRLNVIYRVQNLQNRKIMVPDKVQVDHNLKDFFGLPLPPQTKMDFRKFRLEK